MKKIESFSIDHRKLKRGLYLSREDIFGETVISTFDIRLKEPNREPAVDVPALHSLEHLGATFLRNHPVWGERIVYFGPMGCRTGLYLVVEGDLDSRSILPLVREMFEWISAYTGELPGASEKECGNYLDHNFSMAIWEARKYLLETLREIGPSNLEYPSDTGAAEN